MLQRQGIDFYPTYHSIYETFDYMTKFVDPGFKYHQVLTRLLAEVGRRLLDYPILPINLEDYGEQIVQLRDKFLLSHATKMVQNGIDIRELRHLFSTLEVIMSVSLNRICRHVYQCHGKTPRSHEGIPKTS